MALRVTQPPDVPKDQNGVLAYLRSIGTWASREFNKRSLDDEAKQSILLASPDGSVYTVAVDDAGVLVTTKVSSG